MTVEELGQRMSSAEFTEWVEYAREEPFGPMREDLRAGVIAAVIANVNRTKETEPFAPDDFFRARRPPTVEDRVQQLKAFAGRINAAQLPRPKQ